MNRRSMPRKLNWVRQTAGGSLLVVAATTLALIACPAAEAQTAQTPATPPAVAATSPAPTPSATAAKKDSATVAAPPQATATASQAAGCSCQESSPYNTVSYERRTPYDWGRTTPNGCQTYSSYWYRPQAMNRQYAPGWQHY